MVPGPMRGSAHYRTIFPAVLAALLAACAGPEAPKQAVRAWLERAEAAAEARDRGTLVEMISVLTATLAGTGQSVLDIGARALRFELELELEGGDWRLIGASWRER